MTNKIDRDVLNTLCYWLVPECVAEEKHNGLHVYIYLSLSLQVHMNPSSCENFDI